MTLSGSGQLYLAQDTNSDGTADAWKMINTTPLASAPLTKITDANGSTGTAGQHLSAGTAGGGLEWINPPVNSDNQGLLFGNGATSSQTTLEITNGNALTLKASGTLAFTQSGTTLTLVGTGVGSSGTVTNVSNVTNVGPVTNISTTTLAGTTIVSGTLTTVNSVTHQGPVSNYGPVTNNSTTTLNGSLVDASGNSGTSGQILSSTGTSTQWITPVDVANGTTTNNTLRWNGTSWAESAALTNDGTKVTTNADMTINGYTVGRGGGSVGTNVAFGDGALANNTSGTHSIAIGFEAIRDNSTGVRNVAIGTGALKRNTGSENIAIGINTLQQSAIANSYNVQLGSHAGNVNHGDGNVMVGHYAGNNVNGVPVWNQFSSNSIYIGRETQSATSTTTNEIVIGYDAYGAGSNSIRLGNTSISKAHIQVGWTITSDQKWKENISSLPYGLNLVKALRPVEYTRKNAPEKRKEMGFIAQEVETALDQVGFKDYGFLEKDNSGYSLRYNDFIALSVKAIQELSAENEALKTKVEQDEKLLQQLLKRIEALEKK